MQLPWAGGISGGLTLSSISPHGSHLRQTQPTSSFSLPLACPHLPHQVRSWPSPQGEGCFPQLMPRSLWLPGSLESFPSPGCSPRRRRRGGGSGGSGRLRLTSPPAGRPDPCYMQLSIPATAAGTVAAAAAAAIFYNKRPRDPGRKHAQAEDTACCSRQNLLTLDAPNKFPLRKSPSG